jgi:MATE family multidrug resistance protein
VAITVSWTCMVLPSCLVTFVFHAGIRWMWFFLSLYISLMGVVFLSRFLKGKWKTMRVIEQVPESLDVYLTHIPNPKPEMAPPH